MPQFTVYHNPVFLTYRGDRHRRRRPDAGGGTWAVLTPVEVEKNGR